MRTFLQSIRPRVTSRKSLQKILTNTGWLFVDRVLFTVISITVGAWVARYLGPEGWGLLGYAASFTGLFLAFASLGLDDILVRNLVRKEASQEELLGTAFGLRLVAAGITYFASAIVIWQIRSDHITRMLVLVVAGGLLLQPLNTLENYFQSRVEAKYVVWVKNLALIPNSLLKIVFILGGMSVEAFAWTALLYQLMTAIGLLYAFSRIGPPMIKWRPSGRLARTVMKDAWPIIIFTFSASIFLRIDQILLGDMVDSTAVGIYNAAVKLSEIWNIIPAALAVSLFPAIVRSHQAQREEVYQQRIQVFFDIMIGIGYTVALIVTIMAPLLVNILYGPQYQATITILQIYVWSFLFICTGIAMTKVLLAENMVLFLMFTSIAGAGVNVALNYGLIPRYSGIGAAWATVISYACANYFACLLSPRLWPIFRQITLSLLVPFRLPAVLRAIRRIL